MGPDTLPGGLHSRAGTTGAGPAHGCVQAGLHSGAPAPLSPPFPAGALPAAALGQAFSAAYGASLRALAQAANDRACWTA